VAAVGEIDLNLLRVFDALMETGSVSAAAERLHLSVPAASRALGRLRRAMDDPIMVRAGRGLVPTPFNDGLSPVVAPLLIDRTALEAPGIALRFVSQSSKDPEKLRDGSVDLDIGVADTFAPDLEVQNLFVDHFVALVTAESTLGRVRQLTVEHLCHYPHISASRRGLDRCIAHVERDVDARSPEQHDHRGCNRSTIGSRHADLPAGEVRPRPRRSSSILSRR
jgi:DNA-binding transcriptional LysR family regulator